MPTDLHALEGGMLQDAVVALMGAELRALRSVSLSHVQDPTEVQGAAVTIAAAAYEPHDPCALTRSS